MSDDLTAADADGTVSIVDDRDTLLARYNADTTASKPGFDVLAVPSSDEDGNADTDDHSAPASESDRHGHTPPAKPSGQNLVVAAPHDHSWHLGTFFCQKLIDGVNCWESEALASSDRDRLYGYAESEGYAVDEVESGVTIAQDATWRTNDGTDLVADRREISVRTPSESADLDLGHRGYFVTWEQTLTALDERRHLSSETIHGHYSGLGTRFARSLTDGRVLLPDGAEPGTTTPPRDVSGPRGRWCDYSGPLDGRRGSGEPWTAGITTFDHPANEPHPPRWFIMTEPFGFVAANPTWKRVDVLEPGDSRSWQWGLWIHAGTPDEATIEDAYETFTTLEE